MKYSKSKIFNTVISVFLFLLLSCSSDDPNKSRNSSVAKLYHKGKVKIAAANSFEMNKTQMWEGILLAQEKIERENLCPVKIELSKIDDGGYPLTGMTVAHKIASDNEVAVVIGHGYSDISLPCSLIYQFYGILNFNFISTLDTIIDRNNPLLFSNTPDDTKFGHEIAHICANNGYKNIIIYYLDNNPGISVSNSFELNCNRLGISIANRESFDLSTEPLEIERNIKRWKSNFVFDAVFVAGRMPIIGDIISIMRKNNLNCPILGPDSFDDPLLAERFGPEENDKIFAISNYDPESQTKEFKEFFENFKAKYNSEPDQEALQAYDALIVIAKAIQAANSAIPADIAKNLRGKIFTEAAGPYVFNEKGGISGRKLTAKVFRNGQFVNIESEHSEE
jgi:branched-chain amino acid transport system substrate-binding protein